MFSDIELLRFHRALVETPSVSHEEGPIADWVEAQLARCGARVERFGNNVFAAAGHGPRLLLTSHLDTVPPSSAWTRPPHVAARDNGRVYGLGSNDAKASVAAMTAAFLNVLHDGGPVECGLLLVPEEETGGKGTELAWPLLRERGWVPDGVVVGEPTGLDIAIAQKGLLVLELTTAGDACHSANATGAKNALRELAHDLVALECVDLGPEHALLGRTTMEPTMASAGLRRNMLPASAQAWLDLRTTPDTTPEELARRVQAQVRGQVRVHSQRLIPCACPSTASVVRAAQRARPAAQLYGSRTMSDMVFFRDMPVLKCGPGQSNRSHTADEWVDECEVLEGAAFYSALVRAFAANRLAADGEST